MRDRFSKSFASLRHRPSHANILATRMQRASERKVFDRNLIGPEDENPDQDSQIPDPSAFRKAANSLSTIPFSRKAIVPLSAAALVPVIIAGATLLPFKDLLKAAKGLLLL